MTLAHLDYLLCSLSVSLSLSCVMTHGYDDDDFVVVTVLVVVNNDGDDDDNHSYPVTQH